jgi:hypothetical protein
MTLWHCIMRGLVGTAQPFAPAGSAGRFSVGVVAAARNCPVVTAEGGVAAAAGPALASPGNVKAAAARHAPTVAYNLKRKVNSPERVIREAVESSDTREQPKNSRTRTETQKEG